MSRVIYETLERPSQHFWKRKNNEPVIERKDVIFVNGEATVQDSVLGNIRMKDLGHTTIEASVTMGNRPIEIIVSDQKTTIYRKTEVHSLQIILGCPIMLRTKNGKREVTLRIEEDMPPQEFAGVPAKLNFPPSPLRAGAALEIPRES